jgi:hypothetical protein
MLSLRTWMTVVFGVRLECAKGRREGEAGQSLRAEGKPSWPELRSGGKRASLDNRDLR